MGLSLLGGECVCGGGTEDDRIIHSDDALTFLIRDRGLLSTTVEILVFMSSIVAVDWSFGVEIF